MHNKDTKYTTNRKDSSCSLGEEGSLPLFKNKTLLLIKYETKQANKLFTYTKHMQALTEVET